MKIRHRLPQRVLDDGKAPLRFVYRRGAFVANLVGMPRLADQLFQAALGAGAAFGVIFRTLNRGQALINGVVLLNQRAADNFGGVGGQYQLDAHIG